MDRDGDYDLGSRHLQALVAVWRYGNFAAAAADVGVSQPTLTRTVQRAEEILGAPLFTRTTRRVTVTAAGREFLPLSERLLADIGVGLRNVRELADVERGQLVIASLMSVAHGILPLALQEFAITFPNVEVRLQEGVQASVLEDVRSGAVDFGLGDISNVSGPLETEHLGEQDYRIVLPKGHRLLQKESLTLGDLAGETLISMPPESAGRRLFDDALLMAGIVLNSRVTVTQYSTAFELVARGLGIARAPSAILSGTNFSGIASRHLSSPQMVQQLGIITRRDRLQAPAASVFLELLRSNWPVTGQTLTSV
tara:strand:- start:118 stop:1050 length:933 start_codon:yes stop_codon:yes gene_type:complete